MEWPQLFHTQVSTFHTLKLFRRSRSFAKPKIRSSMDQIRKLVRPTEVPDVGLMCDLLWADPDPNVRQWTTNSRGVSVVFGPDIVQGFVRRHGLELICRAHQVVEDGYEFFANRKLVTLFSAPNYCGEFDNAGAVLSIDETLLCKFQILKPSSIARKE